MTGVITNMNRGDHEHEIVDRGSPSRVERRIEQACSVCRVRHLLADSAEDAGARGAAGLSADHAADVEVGAVPADHSRDSEERSTGSPQAAAHGEADFRASAGRARLRGRRDDREGCRSRLETDESRSLSAALTPAGRSAERPVGRDFGFADVWLDGESTDVAVYQSLLGKGATV